jgi:hypothetical protein
LLDRDSNNEEIIFNNAVSAEFDNKCNIALKHVQKRFYPATNEKQDISTKASRKILNWDRRFYASNVQSKAIFMLYLWILLQLTAIFPGFCGALYIEN